ncbi:MAG TPA: response regulator [Longimicrobiales bacterium]|nr:response regulator [Longimicrobiales bacterium]
MSERSAAARAPERAPSEDGAQDPATILVVDDEVLARETLRDLLESQGYRVITAVDADGAFRHLSDADLLLLDAMLPGKDGWAVCREIKQRLDPLFPIIMVTARTAPEDVVRTFEAGADDYVPKPFQMAELAARIQSRLRAHRAERALQDANRQASELAAQNYRLYERAHQDAEDRATLLRELDHRVRNNLSIILGLVSMERNRRPGRPTDQALASLETRLRAFLLVYEALRRHAYRGVPLREVTQRLAQRLRNTLDLKARTTMHVDVRGGEEVVVDEQHGFALCLVLNELIGNALLHAFADCDQPEVDVQLEKVPEGVRIRVSDNGSGLDYDPAQFPVGSGLSVVHALIETEMGGSVTVRSADTGTAITVLCPMRAS